MIALAFALLLAQGEPAAVAQEQGHHARHEAAAASEAGGNESAHDIQEEKEGESIAGHIFHHVQDETVVPLGFWAGNRYIRLDITKHVINMWIAAGILLIVVGLGARKRALVPKGGYNVLESLVMFVRDEISVKNIGHHADLYTGYGRPLTGDRWYENTFRVEFRLVY